jgi:hypothetical protein
MRIVRKASKNRPHTAGECVSSESQFYKSATDHPVFGSAFPRSIYVYPIRLTSLFGLNRRSFLSLLPGQQGIEKEGAFWGLYMRLI